MAILCIVSPAPSRCAPRTVVTVLTCLTVSHLICGAGRPGIILHFPVFLTLIRRDIVALTPAPVIVACTPTVTITILLVPNHSPPAHSQPPSAPTSNTTPSLCRAVAILRVSWNRTPSFPADSCTLGLHTCSLVVWCTAKVVGVGTGWGGWRGTRLRTATVAVVIIGLAASSDLCDTQADWGPRHGARACVPVHHCHYSWNRSMNLYHCTTNVTAKVSTRYKGLQEAVRWSGMVSSTLLLVLSAQEAASSISSWVRWEGKAAWHCYNSLNQMRSLHITKECFSIIPVCFLGVRGSRLRRGGSSSSDSLTSVALAGGREGPANKRLMLWYVTLYCSFQHLRDLLLDSLNRWQSHTEFFHHSLSK